MFCVGIFTFIYSAKSDEVSIRYGVSIVLLQEPASERDRTGAWATRIPKRNDRARRLIDDNTV